MSYEDQLIRESTGEYGGREQHWCSRCEREAEDCVCNDEIKVGDTLEVIADHRIGEPRNLAEQFALYKPEQPDYSTAPLKPGTPFPQNRESESEHEFLADVPAVVRIALKVLLNHIEPGFENCKTLVAAWLKHIEHEGPK